MPPRRDRTGKAQTQADDNAEVDKSAFAFENFRSMLLNLLRTDEEVRTSVSMIVRSRETDVFSAVVQCLEKDNVTRRMGEFI